MGDAYDDMDAGRFRQDYWRHRATTAENRLDELLAERDALADENERLARQYRETNSIGLKMMRERDALAARVAELEGAIEMHRWRMRHLETPPQADELLAARLDSILDAIGDPDELRWHRWHCDATGSGDDLRDLLVRIADAADPDKSEHGNLRPLTAEDEAIIEDVRRSVQPDPDTDRSADG